MFQVSNALEKAYQFSRFDIDNPLSSCSLHSILLDERNWTTCEHYVQSKSLRSPSHLEIIDKFTTGAAAVKYAKPWYRFKVKNYRNVAPTLMTRALYTKVQMYEEVKDALLSTGDNVIAETSLYDYFWGIGRDQRGHNHLGKIWMNIRDKITKS